MEAVCLKLILLLSVLGAVLSADLKTIVMLDECGRSIKLTPEMLPPHGTGLVLLDDSQKKVDDCTVSFETSDNNYLISVRMAGLNVKSCSAELVVSSKWGPQNTDVDDLFNTSPFFCEKELYPSTPSDISTGDEFHWLFRFKVNGVYGQTYGLFQIAVHKKDEEPQWPQTVPKARLPTATTTTTPTTTIEPTKTPVQHTTTTYKRTTILQSIIHQHTKRPQTSTQTMLEATTSTQATTPLPQSPPTAAPKTATAQSTRTTILPSTTAQPSTLTTPTTTTARNRTTTTTTTTPTTPPITPQAALQPTTRTAEPTATTAQPTTTTSQPTTTTAQPTTTTTQPATTTAEPTATTAQPTTTTSQPTTTTSQPTTTTAQPTTTTTQPAITTAQPTMTSTTAKTNTTQQTVLPSDPAEPVLRCSCPISFAPVDTTTGKRKFDAPLIYINNQTFDEQVTNFTIPVNQVEVCDKNKSRTICVKECIRRNRKLLRYGANYQVYDYYKPANTSIFLGDMMCLRVGKKLPKSYLTLHTEITNCPALTDISNALVILDYEFICSDSLTFSADFRGNLAVWPPYAESSQHGVTTTKPSKIAPIIKSGITPIIKSGIGTILCSCQIGITISNNVSYYPLHDFPRKPLASDVSCVDAHTYCYLHCLPITSRFRRHGSNKYITDYPDNSRQKLQSLTVGDLGCKRHGEPIPESDRAELKFYSYVDGCSSTETRQLVTLKGSPYCCANNEESLCD